MGDPFKDPIEGLLLIPELTVCPLPVCIADVEYEAAVRMFKFSLSKSWELFGMAHGCCVVEKDAAVYFLTEFLREYINGEPSSLKNSGEALV